MVSNLPTNRSVAAFFAHPDDAEILCGGTLVRLSRLGWKIHIITATAGDCGTTTLNPEEIASIRLAESGAAAKMIGGQHHWLGELDGLVTYRPESIKKAIDIFRSIVPTLVFTHPRIDYMLDHEQVHLLARMASFLYAAPNASAQVAAPIGASIPHLYYCDPLGGTDAYTGEPTASATVVDVSKEHELKLRILSLHASQREWLRAHHGIDEYLESTSKHDAERGRSIAVPYAENFTLHHGHAYPKDDLLSQILSTPR